MISAIFFVFLAQLFVTSADVFVRTKDHLFALSDIASWLPRYAATRVTGLCVRLYALFVLPVAAAATTFSATAVCVSTFAAWRNGEALSKMECAAVLMIVAACFLRLFK